jgi:hypothetical protein
MQIPHFIRGSRRARLAVVAGFSAFAALAACGPLHMGGHSDGTQVIFTNEALEQADLYASGGDGGLEVKVGTVSAGRTDTLSMPASVLGQGGLVYFAARVLSRPARVRSGPVSMLSGDEVHVRLPPSAATLVVIGG